MLGCNKVEKLEVVNGAVFFRLRYGFLIGNLKTRQFTMMNVKCLADQWVDQQKQMNNCQPNEIIPIPFSHSAKLKNFKSSNSHHSNNEV